LELERQYNVNDIPVDYSIQTNGYALNEEWCDFFAQHHFLVGLSIDGVKATHDAYRIDREGNGTYLRTLQAAELLRASKVPFNVLTVVHAKTAAKIRRIYEQYRKQRFDWQQYIICLDPISDEGRTEEYSLHPRQYGVFLTELFELWKLDFYKGCQPHIRQFENYLEILLGQVPEGCEYKGVCSIQNVIEADGSVYPCDFYVLDSYKLGNLREDDFETIYRRRMESGFLQRSEHISETCKKCEWYFLCRAGCRRYRENHRNNEDLPYFCEGYRYFFEHTYEEMRKIAVILRG
jgi:uncharacterized protein